MSGASLAETIEIDANPDALLTAFQAIERWSAWYPGVVNAGWVTGEPWAVDAVMQVQVRNSLGMLVSSRATVLPIHQQHKDARRIPDERLCCWENRAPGLVTICYAWAEATTDGSRFTLQKFYRGPAVPLLHVMKDRQQRMLHDALANLRSGLGR